MRNNMRHILPCLCFMLAMMLLACDRKSELVMSERKTEDVLFDYHLADGISRTKRLSVEESKAYFDAVMEKHGITQAEFDSTMVYYMKHADKLHAIYVRLSDRIENEARLQGLDGNNTVSGAMEGDTANIWTMESERIFTTYVPENLLKFHFKADSTYHPGDRFTLSFKTDFLYQDGSRNGYAMISVKFANDSVTTRTTSMTTSNTTSLEIRDNDRLGVKEIRGFIIQREPNAAVDRGTTTLRMMIVSDIKLVKMHTDEPKEKEESEEPDNKEVKSAPDTISPKVEKITPKKDIATGSKTLSIDSARQPKLLTKPSKAAPMRMNNNFKQIKTNEKIQPLTPSAGPESGRKPGMH